MMVSKMNNRIGGRVGCQVWRERMGGRQMDMIREIEYLSQDLCMIGGEVARSDTRLSLPQVQSQR